MSPSNQPNDHVDNTASSGFGKIEWGVLIVMMLLLVPFLFLRGCGGDESAAVSEGEHAEVSETEEAAALETGQDAEAQVAAPAEDEAASPAEEAPAEESPAEEAVAEEVAPTDEVTVDTVPTEEIAPTEEVAAAEGTAETTPTEEATTEAAVEAELTTEAPVTEPGQETSALATTALSLSGTGSAGNTVEVYQDSTLLGQATVDENGDWSFSEDLAFAPGAYTIQVRELDPEGQIVAEIDRNLVIRAAAVSDVEIDQASLDQPTGLQTPTLTVTENPNVPGEIELSGQAEPDSDVQIVVNGQALDTVTADSEGNWTYSTQLPVGDYEIVAVIGSGLAAGLTSPSEALTVGDTGVALAQATVEPTQEATSEPTVEATTEPTAEPTAEPTQEPTAEPTQEATVEPTEEATTEPTVEPTQEATSEPTVEAATEPTAEPTQEATIEPTAEAIVAPAETPMVVTPQPMPIFKYRGPVARRFYRPYFPPRYYWTPHHRYVPRCRCFIRPPWWRPHPPFRFYR